MARTIAQRELRNDNAKIVDAVATTGETFVVTRNGIPVAELRPVQVSRRTFVPRDHPRTAVNRVAQLDRHSFRADTDDWINPEAPS